MPSTRAPANDCCLNGGACRHALPNAALPSAQERNDIGADGILAQELKGLVRRRHAVMAESADSLLPCRHAILIARAVEIVKQFDAPIWCCDGIAGCIYNARQGGINQRAPHGIQAELRKRSRRASENGPYTQRGKTAQEGREDRVA